MLYLLLAEFMFITCYNKLLFLFIRLNVIVVSHILNDAINKVILLPKARSTVTNAKVIDQFTTLSSCALPETARLICYILPLHMTVYITIVK